MDMSQRSRFGRLLCAIVLTSCGSDGGDTGSSALTPGAQAGAAGAGGGRAAEGGQNQGGVGATNDGAGPLAAPAGPFGREYRVKPTPSVVKGGGAIPSESGAAVTLTVEADQVARLISPTLTGNNIAAWLGDGYRKNAPFTTNLQAVNVGLMRFPGGSTSDQYHWDGDYPAAVASKASLSAAGALTTAKFMTLVRTLGAAPLITVNHGYASYGSLPLATALAADWVEYCNSPNDGSNPNGGKDWAAQRAADGFPEPFGVKYWEIGNEVYGKWEVGFTPDGTQYAQEVIAFSDAMKAVDPGIYVGVAASPDTTQTLTALTGPKTYHDWTAEILATPGLAQTIDFLDVHDYFAFVSAGSTPAPADVLPLVSQIADYKQGLDALLTQNPSRASDIRLLFGEFNATHPENPHTVSVMAGLFMANALGEMMRVGFDAACLWDVANGWDATNQGDHGFLSKGSPTIADYTPRPSYYTFYFYTHNFGDQLVSSNTSDPGVAFYASRWSSGQLGLVLVNRGGAPRTASIGLHGFTAAGDVNGWVLTGDALDRRAVSLNGVSNGQAEGGPTLDQVAPYYWNAGRTSTLTVDLAKYSVTSLVIW
jgi:hypothetical protein